MRRTTLCVIRICFVGTARNNHGETLCLAQVSFHTEDSDLVLPFITPSGNSSFVIVLLSYYRDKRLHLLMVCRGLVRQVFIVKGNVPRVFFQVYNFFSVARVEMLMHQKAF